MLIKINVNAGVPFIIATSVMSFLTPAQALLAYNTKNTSLKVLPL